MTARDELLERVVAWFAANGIGDTSMRTLAAQLDTSGRMLHYHFGSREALLGAVVERVERSEQATLAALLAEHEDVWAAGAAFWTHVADTAQTFAALFFELSAHAMRPDAGYAASLREWLTTGWLDVLARGLVAAGLPVPDARVAARLCVATARGLLFELAVTGDRASADAAMARFTDMLSALVARTRADGGR